MSTFFLEYSKAEKLPVNIDDFHDGLRRKRYLPRVKFPSATQARRPIAR